jgi:hypothetical protein
MARVADRVFVTEHIDPLEALSYEIGDALFDLPGDAADRLIWWRAVHAWVWC